MGRYTGDGNLCVDITKYHHILFLEYLEDGGELPLLFHK